MNYICPFDSETGGLDPKTTDMLTFYMCVIDEDFNFKEELYMKLKPDGGRLPIAEAAALKVNGIDIKAHLEDPETITYSQGRVLLENMLKKYARRYGRGTNMIPFGYNVAFDLDYTWTYLIPKEDWLRLMHYQVRDVAQAVVFLKDCGWFPSDIGPLTSVVDYLQIPKRPAHNAKEDTLMLVDVHKRIREIMASKKEGGSNQDLISLLEAE